MTIPTPRARHFVTAFTLAAVAASVACSSESTSSSAEPEVDMSAEEIIAHPNACVQPTDCTMELYGRSFTYDQCAPAIQEFPVPGGSMEFAHTRQGTFRVSADGTTFEEQWTGRMDASLTVSKSAIPDLMGPEVGPSPSCDVLAAMISDISNDPGVTATLAKPGSCTESAGTCACTSAFSLVGDSKGPFKPGAGPFGRGTARTFQTAAEMSLGGIGERGAAHCIAPSGVGVITAYADKSAETGTDCKTDADCAGEKLEPGFSSFECHKTNGVCVMHGSNVMTFAARARPQSSAPAATKD